MKTFETITARETMAPTSSRPTLLECGIPAEAYPDLIRLMSEGDKVGAIKALRGHADFKGGLREAHAIIRKEFDFYWL